MSINWLIYKELNPDLYEAGLRTQEEYESHYLMWGKCEGRLYNINQVTPNFNHQIYKSIYNDLVDMTNTQLELHWLEWGRKEGRISSISQIAPDFNHDNYRYIYNDLADMNNNQLEIHWIKYGKNEGRKYSIIDLYPGFNHEIYRDIYPDLRNMNDTQLGLHWLKNGRFEGRKYSIIDLYPDFNHEIYRLNYSDLSDMNDKQLELHWLKSGKTEHRSYNKKTVNKVSIVMSYYNRKEQTIYTLDGFERMYSGKYNFEVILVDDNSTPDNRLDNILSKYSYPIKYIYITKEEKGERVNPCSAYNKGFENISADTEVVIIQNPECFHYTDLIDKMGYLDFDKIYYTTLVMSSPSFEQNDYIISNKYMSKEKMISYLEDKHVESETVYKYSKGWYNHPSCPNTENHHLHFCSIISKSKLDLLGGFDETYANNYWYDDNEFLFRIKKILKPEFLMDSLVIHLYHENGSDMHNTEHIIASREINKLKYEELKNTEKNNNINWRDV